MEAQKIITMSINKITGSRGQRGGVNLRKNLLVATVLHSARAMYYEEVCKRMARYAEINSNEAATEDEDCTEAADWGDENDSSGRLDSQSSCSQPCLQQQPMEEDKENCQPTSTETSPLQSRLEKQEADPTCPAVNEPTEPSPDKDRMVLGQKSDNSPLVSAGCTACKRKRSDSDSELREACDSVLPKRAKSSDSDSPAEDVAASSGVKQNSEGSITSLVTIFKSGFHGLSGDATTSSTNVVPSTSSTNHLQQSAYTSMPRPFEQLQMPIAAC
jgi:hypothetical protein